MRPRRVELGLLILVWAIGSVAYATVDLATLGTLPVNYLALLLGSETEDEGSGDETLDGIGGS